MIIGRFENAQNGRIVGELDALLADTKPLIFVPNSNGPDYTVLTETACEVGAAWKKTSKDGKKEYLSVRLDSPFLPDPINLALFASSKDGPGRYILVWDRKKPEAE
jgi:uncharacterized protein (DUF736 family)